MATTSISQTDFTKLVKQSQLTLEDHEQTEIRSQLNEALDAIKVFDELDTQGVPPLNQPIEDAHNILREDLVEPSFSQELALSQAQKTHKGYFMIDAIFESEDN